MTDETTSIYEAERVQEECEALLARYLLTKLNARELLHLRLRGFREARQ